MPAVGSCLGLWWVCSREAVCAFAEAVFPGSPTKRGAEIWAVSHFHCFLVAEVGFLLLLLPGRNINRKAFM